MIGKCLCGIVLGLVLAILPAAGLSAAPDDGLYQSHTIVTGTDMRGRPGGFAACLSDVLVKVSGDPRLAHDRRAAALAGRAGDMVADFSYRDRYSGIPKHDEQGTRDRPYTLIVRFDPAKVDAVLAGLGSRPWRGERPPVLALVRVKGVRSSFMLDADGEEGRDQREALAAAAEQYGLKVDLPRRGAPVQTAAGTTPPVRLDGSLTFSDRAGGWVASWRMARNGRSYGWGVRGVSFDDAYRNGVKGALQVLSGHGAPPGLG